MQIRFLVRHPVASELLEHTPTFFLTRILVSLFSLSFLLLCYFSFLKDRYVIYNTAWQTYQFNLS